MAEIFSFLSPNLSFYMTITVTVLGCVCLENILVECESQSGAITWTVALGYQRFI